MNDKVVRRLFNPIKMEFFMLRLPTHEVQDISQLKIFFYLGGILGNGYMSLKLINMILKNYCNCVGMAGVRGAFEGVPYLRIV